MIEAILYGVVFAVLWVIVHPEYWLPLIFGPRVFRSIREWIGGRIGQGAR